MTVKDLKTLLAGMPDEMQVLIPMNAAEGFNGAWFSPCNEETGEIELGLEGIDDEEMEERKLLNKPILTEKSFAIVPCGFFEQHEGPLPELN